MRAFTLDLGDGTDAQQAEAAVRALGIEDTWERIDVRGRSRTTSRRPIRVIEDYHPLDVECAAVGLCLLRRSASGIPT